MRVRAVNTALDSENKIHNDQVAREYGFERGLVPGVTIYGYMASAVIDHFGPEWLHTGAMDVRFFSPYYDGEEVDIKVTDQPEGRIKCEAGTRAIATAWLSGEVTSSEEMPLELDKTLDLSKPGMAAPLDAHIGGFAHPAIILALANELLVKNYTLGPWIHSSSEVRNISAVRDGETVQVRGRIENVYERKGHELAVLDVAIMTSTRLVARIKHTAIWKLRK